MADAGSRLLFKFILDQELMGLMKNLVGIVVGKVIKSVSSECESVSHVLCECPIYSSSRADYLLELQKKLGNGINP